MPWRSKHYINRMFLRANSRRYCARSFNGRFLPCCSSHASWQPTGSSADKNHSSWKKGGNAYGWISHDKPHFRSIFCSGGASPGRQPWDAVISWQEAKIGIYQEIGEGSWGGRDCLRPKIKALGFPQFKVILSWPFGNERQMRTCMLFEITSCSLRHL